jgi:hypothetical protein
MLERWGAELEALRCALGLDAGLRGEPPRVYA